MNVSHCKCPDPAGDPTPLPSSSHLLHTALLTLAVSATFVLTKSAYDDLRRVLSRVAVVVVGAGPVGLTSALIAARSGRVSRVVVYEEKSRSQLLANNHQICLEPRNVRFLASLGTDFDNIEGCWDKGCFSTRIGVFLEYLMSLLGRLEVSIDLRLKSKFSADSLRELDAMFGRVVAVVCDGAAGRAACLLGLSDEFLTVSCRSYGAFAVLERPDQRSVPAPEIRVHNLNFDLGLYDHDWSRDHVSQGFHLKIFGCLRRRCLALAIPRGESRVVKMLKVTLDQSMMRNVFLACYNSYKSDAETDVCERQAARHIQFSPRLFEIKLSHRLESVAFIEDANLFVVTEGDSARKLNFHTGLDMNLGLRGVTSLDKFLQMAASAETEKSLLEALTFKYNHARAVNQEFVKNGLKTTMYT